jgi:glycosyltransferase involved in cell wall biosynthesis
MNRIKIGINGRYLTQPFVGIGRYSINLFGEIARQNPEIQLEIAILEQLDHETNQKLRGIDNLVLEIIPENKLLKKLHPGLAKSYWEKFQLGSFFEKKAVQIVHLPYPALYKKKKNSIPVVITAHDAIPWNDSVYSKRNKLSEIYNKATLKMARLADLVLTVSEASRKEIIELGGFTDNQIKVVHNACEFDMEMADNDKNILTKLGIKKPYLFYMGGYDKRKNIERLIELFSAEIADRLDLQLVLGGGKVLNNNLFKHRKWTERELRTIVETGFLNDKELKTLYQNSQAFISLTTKEGFNLPLLEALTAGVPAIVSDLGVHREVAGELPLYLKLEKSNTELGKEVVDLLNSKSKYNKIKQDTKDAAELLGRKFSWKKAAQETVKYYKQILKNAI